MMTGLKFSDEEMKSRLSRIREGMALQGIEALISEDRANVRYACGFRGEPRTLLITADEIVLFTSFRSISWAEEQTQGIELSTDPDCLTAIKTRLSSRSCCNIGLDRSITHARLSYLQNRLALHQLTPVSIIESVRQIKSPDELKLLEKSQRHNEALFQTLLPQIKPGMTERAVQGIILAEIAHTEILDGFSFTPIVATMRNAWEIHHLPDLTKIKRGDMIILDMGVTYQGYCSDMTRTICVGSPTAEMLDIYSIVGHALTSAIEHIQAGVSCSDIDAIARNIITEAGYGKVFTHGLGHSIGLETHDPGLNLTQGASNTTLQPGMALTVEPGIYLENSFGVRTEDVVFVEEEGCMNITNTLQDLHVLDL